MTLHPNRWFIWAIAISVVMALALVSYIKVSSQNFDNSISVPNASNNWRQYANSQYGFTLNLPPSWSDKIVKGTAAAFGSKANPEESMVITVKDASREKAAEASLEGFTETKITVDGADAREFTSETGEKYVFVIHDKKLFVIRSSSNQLGRILGTFQFLP
ncbi:MAG: hypothetical protein HY336_01315 [Candidatus Doudnabacteria bacterium]|nr:hypothetical protein [Candidatus Doudnabacteria bacterium]